MDPEEEQLRMNHAGLVARSTAGHAARGMKIKDQDDMWVSIQHHTFRNWVNVQLRETGLKVEDLSEDLRDGVALVTLVESLQKRRLRKVKKVMNQHQALENVTTALNAIAEDGIKLVNIGNVDIVNGNLKLILGLVWSLIAHYQIGQSKFPPKKLMQSWLKAVLPECKVTNFTSDWNSGVNLGALVDYCKPGLFRDWRDLDPRNSTENCRRAMEIAKREFNIPMILEPEYLSSPYLDDLSGMTYLSYFMKEGGPGYKATLDWVCSTIPECNVTNFTTDWNDGHALSTLVKKLGGPVPGYKNMARDPSNWEKNLQVAQDGGRKLGVEPVLVPNDMCRRDVEYLGPMAYIANYQWIPARKPASEELRVRCNLENVRVNNPVPFRIDYLSNEVVRSEIRVQVRGPQGLVRSDLDFGPKGAKGEFTPTQVGFYEIDVQYEGEQIEGCPLRVRALPDVSKVMVEGGLEPCALGSIVEVLINSNGTGGDGEMDVKAYAPSRRVLDCPINNDDGVFTAMFQPDEAGEWSIAVTYDDQHIQGSPFHCHVYDPNAIQILNLDDGPKAPTGKPFTLLIDSAACGFGDVKTDVTLAGKSQPSKTLEVDQSLYEVTFTPFEAAKYRVYVYFNGHEVKGSPFSLYLGIEKPPERKSKARKVKKGSSSRESKDVNEVVKEYATNRHKSGSDVLVKTYDSTLERPRKSLGNSHNSSLELNSSALDSKTTFNSSSILNSTAKSTSFDSSSSSKLNSTYEDKNPHTPRIISFNFPSVHADFDVNKNANGTVVSPTTNSKLDKSSRLSSSLNNSFDVVDSSYNRSSFFNSTSTSTVLNSESSNRRTSSLFKKESSPARSSTWTPRHDSRASMSPPPMSPLARTTSPLARATSPLARATSPLARATSPPYMGTSSPVAGVGEDGPDLSAPSRVAQIAKSSGRNSEDEYEDSIGDTVVRTKRIITEKTYKTRRTIEEHHTSSTPSSPKLSPRQRPTSLSPPPPSMTAFRPSSPFRVESPLFSSRPQSPSVQKTLITTLKTTPSPLSFKNPLTPVTKSVTTTTTSIAEIPSPEGQNDLLQNRFFKKSSQLSLNSLSSINSPPPLPSSPPPNFSSSNNHVHQNSSFRSSSVDQSYKHFNHVSDKSSLERDSSVLYRNRVASPTFQHQRVMSPLGYHRDVTSTASNIRSSTLSSFTSPTKSSSIQDISNLKENSSITAPLPNGGLMKSKVYSSSISNLLMEKPPLSSKTSTARPRSSLQNSSFKITPAESLDASRVNEKIFMRNFSSTLNSVKPASRESSFRTPEPTAEVPKRSSLFPRNSEEDLTVESSRVLTNKRYEKSSATTVYESSGDVRSPVPSSPLKLSRPFARPVSPLGASALSPSGDRGSSITGTASTSIDIADSFGDSEPLSPRAGKVHHISTNIEDDVFEKGTIDLLSVSKKFDDKRKIFTSPRNTSFDEYGKKTSDSLLTSDLWQTSEKRSNAQDSFDKKEFSKDKKHFQIDNQDYERSSSRFSRHRQQTPTAENPYFVQSQEYKFESKEYPVGEESSRLPQSHRISKMTGREDSDHEYENVDFKPSNQSHKYFSTKSYITSSSVKETGLRFSKSSTEADSRFLENGGPVSESRRSQRLFGEHRLPENSTDSLLSRSVHESRSASAIDPSRVSVSGSAVRLVGVHENAEFSLSAPQILRPNDVSVEIKGPGPRDVPVTLHPGRDGELIAVFSPQVVGEHQVNVRVLSQHVPGSPFRCYVYDALAIRVGEIPDGFIGRPVEFEIDGSAAGSGNLEILVNGGHVTSHVRSLGDQRFVASFVPHSAILHTVDMTFNGDKVPGSPWRVSVLEGGRGGGRVAVMGENIKHFPAGQTSVFDISAPGVRKEDLAVHIVSPAKRPVAHQITESSEGVLHVSFTTSEVGSYVVEVTASGQKVQGSPFIAKAYDAGLIRVSDVPNGVVGQPCQFKVDASQAGEGQLEISINDGEVPNHVQVLGGGRCLVSFTPDTAKTHTIDIKFNGETVRGCPFKCRVADTSRVSLTLRHLELVPVGRPSAFNIAVDGGGSAELTVTVRTPSQSTLPVRVSGSVKAGFTAEFTPQEVGAHTIIVNYNDSAVSGTPFTCKVYDASKVGVSLLPRGAIGKSLQFIVDASEAGEGNLEISISGHGRNIPTQVHPQGSARFAVSFVPLEAIDHIINISFNKEPVAGSPFVAKVQADPNRIVVSGQNLAATAVGKPSYFTIANVTGSVEDLEINVEGPNGLPVSAQVQDKGDQTFRVEFCPKVAGEHKIHVSYMGEGIPGSPFSCKVYDVNAIKVRPTERGMVGKPVTFLVETNNAGPGNLEVTVNSGQVPTSAQAQGNHEYAISFNPKEARHHVVELRFNGENVPGSPFTCEVVDVSRVTVAGPGLEKVPVDKVAAFTVDAQASADQLGVVITSPSRQHVAAKVVQGPSGKLEVLYTPREVGDHTVEVRVAEVLVPGSPFLVKAFDSSKVKVTEVSSGVVGKPVYFSIDASQAGAGNLEIIVSVNNRNVPNYVQSEGHARFRVNFKPKEAAVHTLSVKFNGEPVAGSPFKCRVTDSSQVLVSGPGIKMSSLARPASFTIDPRGSDVGECLIHVTSPSGVKVPVQLIGDFPKKVTAEFQPTEVGPHSVNVVLDGEPVTGSPFTCNIYDVTRVQVTGLDNTKVNRPVTFTVDASQAGEGTLELVVTTAKASVRAEVAAKSRGLYDVTFTPHEAIPHFVNITFNEEDVIGSPFKCDVRELEPREVRSIHRKESQMVTAKGEGLKKVVTGSFASFMVDTKGLEGDLDIRVAGPDGSEVPASIVRMKNGLHRAEYKPEKVGPYTVTVLHHGSPIATSPFIVEASDPRLVVVEVINECVAGAECSIRVNAAEAGRGALSVGVRAAGQDVKHSIRDLGAGIYQVLFYPKAPVPHKVDVRYNGIPIRSNAFEIPVKNPASGNFMTATGLGLYQARVNKLTAFVIETMKQDTKEFDVLITGPRNWAVPVKCYKQKDGNLLAEYTLNAPGQYKIEVLSSGNHVQGSPFLCSAYDASKVGFEKSRTSVAVGDVCKVKLDTGAAGAADLEAFVMSPSGNREAVEINVAQDGNKVLEWEPQDPGQYKITLLYGGEEVPGSPITVDVGETGLASVSGPGLLRGCVDNPQHFMIDGRGLMGEPQVWVDGPDSVARVNLKKVENGVFQVAYVPHEVGIFDVRVQWNNREVAGSPFHPKIIDPSRVRLIGGWSDLQDSERRLQLIPKQETRLAFDISDAGPGRLKAYLIPDDNEAKELDCNVEQVGNRAKVSFVPPAPGNYKLNLLYNDLPLPESPVVAHAPALAGSDHTRVTLKGHGLTSARCGDPAEFIIDGSNAGPGSPDVNMAGNKADIPVDVKAEGGGIWKATYTPRLPGTYLLNVMWSDRQVRGCPLKVQVDGSADASRVVCSGDGLRHGMVGQDIKSFIDTRRAGPGELTARCTGPNKMAVCELYDHRDGTFTLNIRPQEAGRHQLTMMYENEHVPGSPFLIKVAGAPDPSKVRVYGPGIEHGVLATYQSRFICDTRGAGAGQLTVRIRGPKGAFRVEMQRESQKDRTILCKYDPTEPGDYRVEVKWSGEHVPGSPYMIMIFDTQDELNRYMAGNYSPSGPGAPSDFYGSIGYGTGTYGAVSMGGAASWRGSQAQL